MKRWLALGASTLALGLGGGSALADDQPANAVKVTVSGQVQEWYGYAAQDSNESMARMFEQGNNGFTLDGKAKLDNGVTVEANLGLLASSAASEGGTYYGAVGKINQGFGPNAGAAAAQQGGFAGFSGSFGQFQIGWMQNAQGQTAVHAPSYGVNGLDWNRTSAYIVGPPGTQLHGWQSETFDDYWANKIAYTTPDLGGIQLMVTYTPNMASDDSYGATKNIAGSAWGGQSVSGGLTYDGKFGESELKGNLGMTHESIDNMAGTQAATVALGPTAGDITGIDGGVNFTVSGFTIGGNVGQRSIPNQPAAVENASKTAALVGGYWDLGVGWSGGPWGVAANYVEATGFACNAGPCATANQPLTGTSNGTFAGTETGQIWGLEAQYTLGPGVLLTWEGYDVSYKMPAGAVIGTNKGIVSELGTTINF